MSRHEQNLERLCSKLQLRYGLEDAVVDELRRERLRLEARALPRQVNTAARAPVGISCPMPAPRSRPGSCRT